MKYTDNLVNRQFGVEMRVPLTNKRIDFIIAGEDAENKKNVIVVELKQWDKQLILKEIEE